MVPGGGGLKSSQSVQDDQYDVSPMALRSDETDRLTELSCVGSEVCGGSVGCCHALP